MPENDMGAKLKRQQKVTGIKSSCDATAKPMTVGMLYLVDVRMVNKKTNEKTKKKLLVVGCESADIEMKLRWIFDSSVYDEFSISNVEKVREKVHVISTTYEQIDAAKGVIVKRREGFAEIDQVKLCKEAYDPKLFAVGITTTMIAKDEQHALRKVGNAILSSATNDRSHTGASLSDESTVVVEQIPLSSGYAMPRNVENESNVARFVRG